ncbi:hypothetical protein AAHA92_01981 [Salvia divinorum]|uniref:Uncharacterized protein n=1 Tax=Salvia divinorum TaxID=28513 RepID=A0ABD1ICC1_SALDI
MKEIDAHHFYQHHSKNLVYGSERLLEDYFLIHGDEYFHGKIDKMKLVGEGNVGSWRSLGNEGEIIDKNRNAMKEIDAHHFYQHHPKNLVHGSERPLQGYFLIHGDEYFHGKIDKIKHVAKAMSDPGDLWEKKRKS